MFRFTLGIPGFDDRLIPRFVGGAAAALLAVNHVLSTQPVPDAQVWRPGLLEMVLGPGFESMLPCGLVCCCCCSLIAAAITSSQ